MNDDQFYTRLRFSGKHGMAKMHGMAVSLDTGPDLGSGPVWFIDYRPEAGFGRVQTRSIEPPRDMTTEERRAADELLRKITNMPVIL